MGEIHAYLSIFLSNYKKMCSKLKSVTNIISFFQPNVVASNDSKLHHFNKFLAFNFYLRFPKAANDIKGGSQIMFSLIFYISAFREYF